MKFGIPDAKVSGSGRITDRKTGKVTHFWLGSPEVQKREPTQSQPVEEESNADPIDQRS